MNPLMKTTIAVLMLVMVGCATPPRDNQLIAREELKVDPEVRYFMTVTELFQDRIRQADGSSILQVQFAAEALNDGELAWKVTWFDEAGMQVKGVGEGYRRATLLAGQNRFFTTTAPHPRVISYQLHLREPK